MESIAKLAERLPEDRVEHNIANLPKIVAPDAVQRSDQPVGEIARNIDTSGCWMVLKNIERDPEYKRCWTRAWTRWPPTYATARAA